MSSSAPARRQSTSLMDTDSESEISDRPPVDLFVEEGELSNQEHEISATDPDLSLSEEQNYRETMSGPTSQRLTQRLPSLKITLLRVLSLSQQGKSPLACPRMNGFAARWENLTSGGYSSRNSEAGGLLKDQFVRPPQVTVEMVSLCTEPEEL